MTIPIMLKITLDYHEHIYCDECERLINNADAYIREQTGHNSVICSGCAAEYDSDN